FGITTGDEQVLEHEEGIIIGQNNLKNYITDYYKNTIRRQDQMNFTKGFLKPGLTMIMPIIFRPKKETFNTPIRG
ncbi:hypothetical protein ACJX0J_007832, partial [Zea mays]